MNKVKKMHKTLKTNAVLSEIDITRRKLATEATDELIKAFIKERDVKDLSDEHL